MFPIKNTISKTAILLTALLVLSGCGPSAPDTDTPSLSAIPVAPHVTLSVPPTANEGDPIDVVITSTGHDGEQAKLYAFPADYDYTTDCTDLTVDHILITLAGGRQTVTTRPHEEGSDLFWVLTGNGISTECGSIKTRILSKIVVTWTDFTTGTINHQNGPIDNQVDILYTNLGEYRMAAGLPAPMTSLNNVSIAWIGPFATAPEAHSTPCPIEPVAHTETFTLTTQSARASQSELTPVPALERGIYRILITAPATEYSMAQVPVCEDATLVVIT